MKLFLHLLMLALLSAASARVVQDFEKDCGKFFARGISPTRLPGSQYKQICQTLNGVPYYATFYDTHNRIPVYSAYKFEGFKDCKRLGKWYIEPQLDDNNASPNMQFESDVKKSDLESRQALNGDYAGSGQDKGHLEPVYQANSQSCADATFTLTNAAPQDPSFNRGQWRVLEEKMAENLTNNCPTKQYSVYIVTGVVPDKGKTINNKVNVPSHFWTAYCCYQNKKCQITGGFIAENTKNIPKKLTVTQLESELTNLYKVSFELFESSSEPPLKKLKTGK